MELAFEKMDPEKNRYPFCIVWTPIPILSWIFPFIGHMGICTSTGVIRDFAGPYYVSEDDMAFGNPTRYWRLDPSKGLDGVSGWDRAIAEASETYNGRIHNLCCDNCHSHVAHSLNIMIYDGSASWNMVKLCFLILLRGHYVSEPDGELKKCLPPVHPSWFMVNTRKWTGLETKVGWCCDCEMMRAVIQAHGWTDTITFAPGRVRNGRLDHFLCVSGFIKSWLPFLLVLSGIVALAVLLPKQGQPTPV